ncbi:MAG: polyketide synthase dehydratase domain-containing protein [Solirubrobacterales bacterium]|nr:polyketide synthase dehydratase domain-containing protein [Solirubrobacterales bacterium]
MCKSASALRRAGTTRAVAIDWSAWAGIGMASRGSIPRIMEMAGIDMLDPAAAVPVVRRELTAGGPGGEVVVAGRLGLLLEERHEHGGLDAEAATAAMPRAGGPMTGTIVAHTLRDGLVVRTSLDPHRQAFLDDHRIDGTPVLPGVMGMEGFAEAAAAVLPGWQVVGLEDVDLLAPCKFYRDEPRTLELRALVRDGGDGTLVADCRLVGRRTLAGGEEQESVHFTGRARLARELPDAPAAAVAPGDGATHHPVAHDAVYRVYFHGPAYRVLDAAWRDDGHVVGRLAGDLPLDHDPPEQPMVLLPRLIELCFQTAGVWELGTAGRMGLPTHVDRVRRYAAPDGAAILHAVVTPRDDGGTDAEVVAADGHVVVALEGYRTTELPGGVDEELLAPIRDAMR